MSCQQLKVVNVDIEVMDALVTIDNAKAAKSTHGDDFVSVASDKDLEWLKEQVEKKYELKTQVLGPEKGDMQEVKVS